MNFLVDALKITIVFDNPFALPDDILDEKLTSVGYESQLGRAVISIAPDGSRTQVIVWEKETRTVGYDPKRGYLSAQAKDFRAASVGLGEMLEVVRSMEEDYTSQISFAEIIMNARARGSKYPLVALDNLFSHDFLPEIGDILGSRVSPYAIRVCPKDKIESKKSLKKVLEWFELTVQPMVENPRYYLVSLVYRNPDVGNVSKFAGGLEAKMEKLLAFIEAER